jgi:hypothetical protein
MVHVYTTMAEALNIVAMTCFCCGRTLVRGSDLPEAHWLRQGDFYCRRCDLLIWREEVIEGWPAGRLPCRKHVASL